MKEERIKKILGEVDALKDEIKSDAKGKYEAGVDKAEEVAKNLEEKGQEMWNKTKKGGEEVKNYVETHPWQSVAIAAGIGMLLGTMFKSRKND